MAVFKNLRKWLGADDEDAPEDYKKIKAPSYDEADVKNVAGAFGFNNSEDDEEKKKWTRKTK